MFVSAVLDKNAGMTASFDFNFPNALVSFFEKYIIKIETFEFLACL